MPHQCTDPCYYHHEMIIIEKFFKENLKKKLSFDQLSELRDELAKNSSQVKQLEELQKKYEELSQSFSASLSAVCIEVPMEWLLTHQDSNLRKKGKEQHEALDAISKVNPSLIENCSTFGEVLLKWKAYGEHIESL